GGQPGAVRRRVQPAADARGVGERHDRRSRVLERRANALVERAETEQPPDREAADGEDQLRPQQPELPLEPEPAQLLLARAGDPVAGARRRPAGIAARDRRAVEGGVELVLVEVEPAAEVLPGAAAPGSALVALDRPRRLAVDVGALAFVTFEHRQGLERVAGLDARPADTVVALQRGERAVARAPPRHARTSTNQRPSKRTSPPPSSASRPAPVKKRL